MGDASSWSIFPPKSVNVAASLLSHGRLPKGFAGSSMKRSRRRLFHWTFLPWRKIVLPGAVNRRVCGHCLPVSVASKKISHLRQILLPLERAGRDIALRCPPRAFGAARHRYSSLKFSHAASANRVGRQFPINGSRLAIAGLAAIACATVVHRAIFAALFTGGLIRRKRHCANHRRENRK